MTTTPASTLKTAIAVACACTAATAWAGRPLTVDDANTNEKGAGHVEAWVARAAGSTVLNVSPAYAPIEGLELALAFARDTGDKVNAGTAQLKYLLIAPDDKGCNLGATLGATRVGKGGGTQRFVNGLATCNFDGAGSLHLNLGVVKPSGDSSVKTWGVAFEREFGPVTPHIEFFGEKGGKPTVQIGARTQIVKDVQLDGTVGRHDGETLYSLGLKFQF